MPYNAAESIKSAQPALFISNSRQVPFVNAGFLHDGDAGEPVAMVQSLIRKLYAQQAHVSYFPDLCAKNAACVRCVKPTWATSDHKVCLASKDLVDQILREINSG